MAKMKYIGYDDRIRIELLYNVEKNTPAQIAAKLGYSERTIYRELKRGWCENLDKEYRTIKVYGAQKAQKDYEEKAALKGPRLKIGNDFALASFIEDKIVKYKYSPGAVLYEIRRKGLKFSVNISRTTLYKYINDNLFLELSNDHLPYGKRPPKKRNEPRRISYKDPLKESIENRPAHIAEREEFGHWEMDTIYSMKGDGSTCLLVLTERKTRDEISTKMAARTAPCVVKALDKIEREFDRYQKGLFQMVFKSFAADNGSEFSDIEGIERSCYKKRGKRTKVYFCHPFCSYERGSNENLNKMIRRFIPKGAKISDYTHEEIAQIIKWVNNYPRGIFDGLSSNDLFIEEVKKLIA